MIGFRYQLCPPDGDVFGEAEYAYQPSAGEEIYRRMRVVACVPAERIEEFVERPLYGILEVEPCAG